MEEMSGVYSNASAEHKDKTDKLLAAMHANNGLAPLDVEQFWKDQEVAKADPFGRHIPQCAFGAILNWECVFDELGVEQDWWRFLYEDEAWGLEISKHYNDLSEKIVGRRLLNETPKDRTRKWPEIKGLHDIFEAKNVWEGGANGSWWLMQSANTPEELSALLDRVEKRLNNLREFMLPENWDEEKKRLLGLGCSVPLYRAQRGPCTFATSIYGAENLLMLGLEDPGLLKRLSDVLGRAIIGRAEVLDAEAGEEAIKKAPRGWSWFDDNCCLFTPEMYEVFAMPIHRAVFGKFAPDAASTRFQHSDSAMGHLLPLLSDLNLTGTNFGPTLTVSQIREHCPNAVIDGQMAPFTYSRNEGENIVAEFLRDFDQAREKRGLNFATAGSINNGSRLTGMRLLMACIQQYGRY